MSIDNHTRKKGSEELKNDSDMSRNDAAQARNVTADKNPEAVATSTHHADVNGNLDVAEASDGTLKGQDNRQILSQKEADENRAWTAREAEKQTVIDQALRNPIFVQSLGIVNGMSPQQIRKLVENRLDL